MNHPVIIRPRLHFGTRFQDGGIDIAGVDFPSAVKRFWIVPRPAEEELVVREMSEIFVESDPLIFFAYAFEPMLVPAGSAHLAFEFSKQFGCPTEIVGPPANPAASEPRIVVRRPRNTGAMPKNAVLQVGARLIFISLPERLADQLVKLVFGRIQVRLKLNHVRVLFAPLWAAAFALG